MPDAAAAHRSGFVAIAGRPNCGKSTLLNRLLGQKISIVTAKPQTTRTRILGVKTLPHAQLILIDTPGLHRARDLLNRRMVEVAAREVEGADVAVGLIDASAAGAAADPYLAPVLAKTRARVCVALNKIDLVDKRRLLPLMAELGRRWPGAPVVPVSALTGENVEPLVAALVALLPEGPRHYPEDELTDQTERALVQEIIREKVIAETQQEVPYATAVTIDSFEEKPDRRLVVIGATIHVNRRTQKAIVVGRGGSRIKRIGQLARTDIERLLGRRVFLELFVRVQEGWTADARRLKEFGL